jgi:hypothetical protein
MSEVSPAYEVAEHVHAAFFEPGILSPAEIAASEVKASTGSSSSTTSQRVEAWGFVDNRAAKQTLARTKHGIYHLSTTYITYGGRYEQTCIQPRSDIKILEVVVDSLFMHKLVAIAHARQDLNNS